MKSCHTTAMLQENSKENRIVAPSLLAANFFTLSTEIAKVHDTSAQWIHLDVMDGHFVPNLTFGPKIIQDLRPQTDRFLDSHLMVSNPDFLIPLMAEAGVDAITIHSEAVIHLHRSIQTIKALGKLAGVSIVPSTPVSALSEILSFVDIVLVMTVNPGFGGQSLIESASDKIKSLDAIRIKMGYNFRISVDGGVNSSTAPSLWKKGADILVTGSSFFSDPDPRSFTSFLLSC